MDKEPDAQYDDIKQILDVNLRLLKKSEKEPSGFGARMKAGSGRGKNPGCGSENMSDNPLANSSESERAYQLYKQEYTLLPMQKLFKIERMSEYERDELLKKWQLDRMLQQRKEQAASQPQPQI